MVANIILIAGVVVCCALGITRLFKGCIIKGDDGEKN